MRRAILGILIGVLALVALFEVGVRLPIDSVREFRHGLDPIGREMEYANIRPHPYLAYANKPDWERPEALAGGHTASHNSLGFRGPEVSLAKPDGVFRVLCLGGSSTYGHGPSSNETTWPARLEALLREARPGQEIEVINAGTRGYSTFESVINLSIRGLDFEPDVVTVYHAINDMRCALYGEPVPDNSHWRAVWLRSEPAASEKLFGWSQTFLALRRYTTDYLAERGNIGSYVIVDFDGETDPYNPRRIPEQGVDSFARNLRSIAALAREYNAEPVFITQACDPGDLSIYKSRTNQLAALKLLREKTVETAATEEVLLIDAAPVLEEAARLQRLEAENDTIFTREVHLTDEGAELLAHEIASGLLAADLVPGN